MVYYNKMMNKYDDAHMEVAKTYAKLSSARRMQVGCILVKDQKIISIGYNGMPSGWTNDCEEVVLTDNPLPDGVVSLGNDIKLKTKPEVLHAETNAIAKVARSTESAEGATCYTTCAPCLDCAKLIYQAGIERVVYGHRYKDDNGLDFLTKCGVEVLDYESETRKDL